MLDLTPDHIPEATSLFGETLYRHRGHRYISIRAFDKAVADLERTEKIFQQVIAGTCWSTFGNIAAEADLKTAAERGSSE